MLGELYKTSGWRCPADFPQIGLDGFVVMPNHIHGIVLVGAQFIAPSDALSCALESPKGAMNRALTLGEIVRAYKALSTREIRRTVANFSWQRNYYEHIIRNEKSLNRIRQYIVDNPLKWDSDRENPAVKTPEPKDAWQLR